MKCRHCQCEVALPLIDLGSAPPSNAYLTPISLRRPEKWFPLKVVICETCWLVQAEAYSRAAELFNEEYAYFSSFSSQWLKHAESYVKTMLERFALSSASRVIEVASNDGYLLQYVKARGIPCLGIEPTASTAAASRLKGIETLEEFFGVGLAKRLVSNDWQADLIAANNVLAHVPDINDFAAGFAILLKPSGVATFEFPHLINLIENNQFDTIYHEHFSYLSLTAVQRIFASNGLQIFDVEEHPTHGGSIRVFAQRGDMSIHPVSQRVHQLLQQEDAAGMRSADYYAGFQARAEKVRDDFVHFLIEAKRRGQTVAAYGAAAKGNTLMNFAGIRPDLIRFVVDRNPAKQGKFMPGSRIPIVDEAKLAECKPDFVVILPWNLKDEIMLQLASIRSWNGRFVTAIPSLEVLP
ncbi:MAG: class I SAM-dependent methyltransferase [Verrucomicrobiota bacterium]